MCDDFTAQDEEHGLARRGLTRRQFAAMGAFAAIAGCAETSASGAQLLEDMVNITTDDGMADAFFVRPAKGAHPGIVMWPDIAGLREVKKIMARRLAADGFAVLVANQYYRSAPAPIFHSLSDWRTPEGQEKLGPMREQITPEATMRDARAFVAYLDAQETVDKGRKVGSNGYCMGGPFTVRTAAAVPGRVGAAASFHGGWLVTEEPDSPHRLLGETHASYLFAIARNDDAREPDAKKALRKAARAASRPAEIEVYPADHGWCVADSPAYDPEQAERAWSRMLALFKAL